MADNDVIAIVPPETGADEMLLHDESNPDVALPVGMYLGQREGTTVQEPALLFRFRPSTLQRGKIAIGEDLYLLMILPNGRAPLPIELQVGPGSFQLESKIVGVDGEPIVQDGEQRSALWTPESEGGAR